MGFLVFIILIAGIVYYTKVYNTPNAKKVREIAKGKTDDQVKTIEYFLREGCLVKTISDEEYETMIRKKIASMDLKEKALRKLGVDEDEVNEISPVNFGGYRHDKDAYSKRNASNRWVSSKYEVSWIFFSSTQVYIYKFTFNMDEDKTRETTEEFFYKDVTSFSTSQEIDYVTWNEKQYEVTVDNFTMTVPGDKLYLVVTDLEEADTIISGMKQKLREKKM